MLQLRRCLALLVDLAVVAGGAGLGAGLPLLSGERDWGVLALMLFLAPALGALALIVQIGLAARWRRTLGQRALGLRLVDETAPPSGLRVLGWMALLVLLPALMTVAAWGAGAIAQQRVESWGSRHPDWQRRLDAAYAERDSAHDRLEASQDSDQREAAWRNQEAAVYSILALLAERDRSLSVWLVEQADALIAGAIVLWLLANGALLFTRRGPLHDRLCRLRVERA